MAQPIAIDIHAGAFIWLPISSFRDVSGIPSPERLSFASSTSGEHAAFSIGADLLQLDTFLLGIQLGYQRVSMRYNAIEREPIALPGGQLYTASLRHDIVGRMELLLISPRMRYKPLSWLSLEGSLPLQIPLSTNYVQVMRFVDPAGLMFVDGSLEQVTGNGAMQNVRQIIPSIAIHAAGEIPIFLNGNVHVMPRIGFQYAVANATADGAYRIHGIDASLGIRVQIPVIRNHVDTAKRLQLDTTADAAVVIKEVVLDSRIERDTIVELRSGIQQLVTELMNVAVDTIKDQQTEYRRVRETYRTLIPKPPSVLRGSIDLQFVDDDGTVTDKARLTATRISARRVAPLVPFVVFDSSSSEIPKRYVALSKDAAVRFQERSAIGSEDHWHYQILNIIGSRMRSQSNSVCQLQMYSSSSADTALGNMRLRAVRAYLTSRFGIAEGRIRVVPSETGLSEDDNKSLASSVVVSDPSGKLLLPVEGQVSFVEARLPTVRITPDVITESGLRTWSIAILQDKLERYEVVDSSSEVHDVTINLNDVMSADAALKSPLSFVLRLQDAEYTTAQSEPVLLSLTSKALRPSERATPLRRTEVLRVAMMNTTSQQVNVTGKERVFMSPAWSTNGLALPELHLYQHGAKVYIQEERQP